MNCRLDAGEHLRTGWRSFGNALASGWSVSSIITAQSGFPFTPQLSYNPSNNGDTRNPVRPFVNPSFTGSVVTGNPNQWFNPDAFIAPPSTSGFTATWEETRSSGRAWPRGISLR